jgi:hypothetical protein
LLSVYGLFAGPVPRISAILGVLTIIVWLFPLLAAFLEKAKKNQLLLQ